MSTPFVYPRSPLATTVPPSIFAHTTCASVLLVPTVQAAIVDVPSEAKMGVEVHGRVVGEMT